MIGLIVAKETYVYRVSNKMSIVIIGVKLLNEAGFRKS